VFSYFLYLLDPCLLSDSVENLFSLFLFLNKVLGQKFERLAKSDVAFQVLDWNLERYLNDYSFQTPAHSN
jgi:hypothetical protein